MCLVILLRSSLFVVYTDVHFVFIYCGLFISSFVSRHGRGSAVFMGFPQLLCIRVRFGSSFMMASPGYLSICRQPFVVFCASQLSIVLYACSLCSPSAICVFVLVCDRLRGVLSSTQWLCGAVVAIVESLVLLSTFPGCQWSWCA
jgi:hypothetical protein